MNIWTHEATGLNMIKEWSMRFSEKVIAMDWYFSSDGQHCLAVLYQSGVLDVYSHDRRSVKWGNEVSMASLEKICSMTIPWNELACATSWMNNGTLLVASNNCLRLYDKWMTSSLGTHHSLSLYLLIIIRGFKA